MANFINLSDIEQFVFVENGAQSLQIKNNNNITALVKLIIISQYLCEFDSEYS